MNRLVLALMLWPSLALSGNYYIESVESARPDPESLEKARKRIDEHRDVEVIRNLDLPPFHYRPAVESDDRKPLCTLCHLDPPHRRSERKRSFLNQHARFIACETCHLKAPPGDAPGLRYRWLAYRSPHAGEWIDVAGSVHSSVDDRIRSAIPRPGAHIAPEWQGRPALVFRDQPFARDLEQSWKQASPDSKAEMQARLHDPIDSEGTECKSCHDRDQQKLDTRLLGMNERQVRALEGNLIARFFARYRKDDERLRMTDLLR